VAHTLCLLEQAASQAQQMRVVATEESHPLEAFRLLVVAAAAEIQQVQAGLEVLEEAARITLLAEQELPGKVTVGRRAPIMRAVAAEEPVKFLLAQLRVQAPTGAPAGKECTAV